MTTEFEMHELFATGSGFPHAVLAPVDYVCYVKGMTRLLEDALQKVGKLSEDEQNGIASQILKTLEDEEAWRKTLQSNPAKLREIAGKALDEDRRGETLPLDEIL
jgi:hypothetical protein